MSGRPTRYSVCLLVFLLFAVCFAAKAAEGTEENRYVGIHACQQCHPEQYQAFISRSPKAASSKGVTKLLSDLDPKEREECYSCHTTGHNQPGGFKSFEETPEMANIGCESCHGPGYLHMASGGDPSRLVSPRPGQERCDDCHNPGKREGLVRILKNGMAH